MKLTITLLIALLLSGCTSTQTTSQIISDDTIKAMITAVSKLDKDQVKKLEEAIKEKLKDETIEADKQISSTDSQTQQNKTEEKEILQENKEEQIIQENGTEIQEISDLNWTRSGDPHGIVQCYFGYGHDSELFKMISALPVDFTCTLDNSGVTISCPASDDTGMMSSYPGDHMQARRAFVCLFNDDNNLVDCQDFAESFHLDNRWKNKGAVKGLTVHCNRGNAVSRTALTEVE